MGFISNLTGFSENTTNQTVKLAEKTEAINGYTFYSNGYVGEDTVALVNNGGSTTNSNSLAQSYSSSHCVTETRISEAYKTTGFASTTYYSGTDNFNGSTLNDYGSTASELHQRIYSGVTESSYNLYYSVSSFAYIDQTTADNGSGFTSIESNISASYYSTTNTDSETLWQAKASWTYKTNENGTISQIIDTGYGGVFADSIALYTTAGTTSENVDFKVSTTTQLTSYFYFETTQVSTAYQVKTITQTTSTISGLKTFSQNSVKLGFQSPKTYNYSALCPYDRTGNLLLTVRTQAGNNLRNSDYNSVFNPAGQATFSYADYIASSFNSGQASGYSSQYTLTINSLSPITTTITKTNVNVLGTGDTARYSTSTQSEEVNFWTTQSTTESFEVKSEPYSYGTSGSYFSASCPQMVNTTSTYKTFLYAGTLTTSFSMTSYIFTTSGHTFYANFIPWGSESTSVLDTYSTTTQNIITDAPTYSDHASTTRYNLQSSGSTNYSHPQWYSTCLGAFSTNWRHPVYNSGYTSTYYTESANVGNFINGANSAYFEFSPSSASQVAFIYSFSNTEEPPYTAQRPRIRIIPYSGIFNAENPANTTDGATFYQTYSASSTNTTFYQTLTYSSGTGLTTSSRSINFALSNSFNRVTSEMVTMLVDSVMYQDYLVPQVYPDASNILYTNGYLAGTASYYLNDYIKNNKTGTPPQTEYIVTSNTFSYPISKANPNDGNVFWMDHGKFSALTYFTGTPVFGQNGAFGDAYLGLEFNIDFFQGYPTP